MNKSTASGAMNKNSASTTDNECEKVKSVNDGDRFFLYGLYSSIRNT